MLATNGIQLTREFNGDSLVSCDGDGAPDKNTSNTPSNCRPYTTYLSSAKRHNVHPRRSHELDKTWHSPHNVHRSTHVESGKSDCVSNFACASNLKNCDYSYAF